MHEQPESQIPEQDLAPDSDAANDEIQVLRARVAQLEDSLLRERAEAENQRKRVLRDVDSARKYGTERLVSDLLPALDSLEKGLELAEGQQATVEQLKSGSEMTLKLLAKAVEAHGLRTIDPLGQPFSPDLHQAMAMQPAPDATPGSVIKVLQKGYLLADRLVRPALVIVARDDG
jgi:molecular chaperone GrpE